MGDACLRLRRGALAEQRVPPGPPLAQDAWRGRQSAATTLAHMDSFFKTVLTSSMGNDLQVGGRGGCMGHVSSRHWGHLWCAAAHVPAHLPPTPPHTHTHLQNKDLALPQHSDRAHKLLADNDTTVHMSYDVRAGAGMGAGGVVLVGSMGGHSRPAGPLLICTCCYSTCRCTEHWQQWQQRRRDSPVYCRTL